MLLSANAYETIGGAGQFRDDGEILPMHQPYCILPRCASFRSDRVRTISAPYLRQSERRSWGGIEVQAAEMFKVTTSILIAHSQPSAKARETVVAGETKLRRGERL